MAIRLPFSLRQNVILGPEVTVSELWDFVMLTVVARPTFRPDFWCTREDLLGGEDWDAGKTRGRPPADAVKRRGESAFLQGFEIQGEGGGVMVQPLHSFEPDDVDETFGVTDGWRLFDLNISYRDNGKAYLDAVELQHDVLRGALARFHVRHADIRRVSNTYLGPTAELAHPEAIASLAHVNDLSLAYPDADAFWAVWDRVEHLARGKALCTRALATLDETEFKARVLKDGFALGRAARPGATHYYQADPSPDEQGLLDGMPHYLTQSGYDPASRSLEFTAVVEKGEHLTPADILGLVTYQDNGTSDGQPVERLIVTFPDEVSARAEAAPLRDIGARIQFFSPNGSWETLE